MNVTFTGIGSSLYETPGNWSRNALPASADDVRLVGTRSLAGSDQSAVDLATFSAGSGFTGGIGTSDAYLIVGSASVSLKQTFGGDIYLDSGSTHNIEELLIDSSASQTIYLKGDIAMLAVTHGRIVLMGGTITDLYAQWDGTGSKPTIINAGGTIVNQYRIEDCTVSLTGESAEVTNEFGDAGMFTASEGTVVNYHQRGGTIYHDTDKTSTVVNAFGGTFDMSRDDRAKTVTTLNEFAASKVNTNNGPKTVTIVNHNIFKLQDQELQSV